MSAEEETPVRGLPTSWVVTAGRVGCGRVPRGRVLWQRPQTPGTHREQGVLLRTQAHLRHLDVHYKPRKFQSSYIELHMFLSSAVTSSNYITTRSITNC